MKVLRTLLNSEYFLVIVLLLVAAVPRVIFLDSMPSGIHGDEGWTGMDARRILQHGVIEPYAGSALGQPTGPLYMTALFFKLFGDSIFTLRLSMAVFGIVTIPLFYVFLRLFFSKTVSFLVAIALCFSLLHLHFSRTAFMLISAPVFALTTLILITLAIRNKSIKYSIIAGIIAGLGIYSYNTYIYFLVAIYIGFFIYISKQRFSAISLKQYLGFLISLLIFSFPLLHFIITKPNEYFSHSKTVSIFSQRQFIEASSVFERITIVINHVLHNAFALFQGQAPDGVDAFGIYFTFGLPYLMLMLIGTVVIVVKRPRTGLFLLLSLPFVLLPSLLGVDGIYRRAIIAVPFFFTFMAYGVVYLQQMLPKKIFLPLILVLIFVQSYISVNTYFDLTRNNSFFKYIYTTELTQTVLRLKSIRKPDEKVFFLSQRWSCNYETIKYIIPDMNCVDLSKEYGVYNLKLIEKNSAVVLLDSYTVDISTLQKNYSGTVEYITEDDHVMGLIYQLK